MGSVFGSSAKEDDYDNDSRFPDRLPIDVGNSIELRRILDEATIRAIDDCDYAEDQTMGNIKLAIMTFACAVALLAQFNPYEFPGNRMLLAVCVSLYCVCSGVMQLIFMFVDEDFIFISMPRKFNGQAKSVLAVQTTLKRFQENYTLKFEWRMDNQSKEELKEHLTFDHAESVGSFFDQEGFFDEERYNRFFRVKLKAFEKKATEFVASRDTKTETKESKKKK